jgi:hypothetical protein
MGSVAELVLPMVKRGAEFTGSYRPNGQRTVSLQPDLRSPASVLKKKRVQ